MALIGTIRKNTWVLVVLIALGMGGFILQSIVSGGKRYAAGDNFTLGKVNGEKIDYREFQETERILYGNSGSDNVYANKTTLWNYFKNKTISETIAEEIGMGVSTEELLELEFGDNLSPIISTRFKNQQTGLVDKSQLDKIKQMIDEDKLNEQYKRFWAVQEKEIIYDRLKTKMSNLVSKSIYTPSWYAEDSYKFDESKSDFNYVKIPFDKISDDEIEVTDQDIMDYINNNKVTYTNLEETRSLKYIVIDVKPSVKDIKVLKESAEQLAKDFSTAENDSLFAVSNEGIYTNIYYKSDELPDQIKNDSSLILNIGTVIGPYEDKDNFTVAKILDKKIVPDSAKARHILRSVKEGDVEGMAAARSTIDSIKTILESGKESFDSLAIKFSQDPGSAAKGGELGTFTQGRMVPAFNDVCFHGNEKEYYVVTTRFGVHLIDVQKQIYNDRIPKYKVAYVTLPIVPSQETQDSLYEIASELLITSASAEDFDSNATKLNFEIKKSMPLKANDYTFMSLGAGQTSRDIIRWAFEEGNEKGDLSPTVYSYNNKKNYYSEKYVLVLLDNIYPKGLRSVDDVRSDVETLVMNQLKGEKIIEKISEKNLEKVAALFDLKTETASQVAFNSKFVPNLGNEPQVLSYAFNGEVGKVYGPIIGNSGVFMVSPSLNQPTQATPNLVNQKKTMSDKARANISYKLLEEISKNVEIDDIRKKFF